jgi:pimeloyl-ACP methyl ester carboxylesterase
MKVFSQLVALGLGLLTSSMASADNDRRDDSTDVHGSNFTYPYPVKMYRFVSQHQQLSMAHMDVPPTSNPNGDIVMVLHGKNFCSATWNETIHVLTNAGYRVIAPDQIGFCKSTKPSEYQYSLQQLALNTQGLLESLNVTKTTVIGHSMGGMLATRFALMYPQITTRLVLTNPIGLEDWKAKGVPYQSIETTYISEHASTYDSIRGYEQATYYVGQWSPAYDVWVNMLLNIYQGSEGVHFAWDMALVTDMVLTQPVVYEFRNLTMPTLLLIGDKDNTAIGKAWSPPAVQAVLGHYDVLGKQVAAMIPNATLIEFPNLGHAPQISDPTNYHKALVGWLWV